MARIVLRMDMTKGKAELKRLAIQLVRREHARIMAAEPRPMSFRRYVDMVEGKPEEAVRDDGHILYQYSRLDEVVRFALATLREFSPRLSGAYADAHTLFVNGQPAAPDAEFSDGDDIAITNLVPYSRKIEVGKMKMRVPGSDVVYQRARREIARRFGNHASVSFTYRAVVGGHQVNQGKAGVSRFRNAALNRPATGAFEKTLRPSQHNASQIRFPTLVIEPAGAAPGRRRR